MGMGKLWEGTGGAFVGEVEWGGVTGDRTGGWNRTWMMSILVSERRREG